MAEWDKLQEHFETRTVDLRAEVDRLNRALTDAKVAELNKITSLEQLLTEAKQKAAQHEVCAMNSVELAKNQQFSKAML